MAVYYINTVHLTISWNLKWLFTESSCLLPPPVAPSDSIGLASIPDLVYSYLFPCDVYVQTAHSYGDRVGGGGGGWERWAGRKWEWRKGGER